MFNYIFCYLLGRQKRDYFMSKMKQIKVLYITTTIYNTHLTLVGLQSPAKRNLKGK